MKIINKDSLKLFCLVAILVIALPAHAKRDKHKSGHKIHAWEKADAILHQRIDGMQSEPKLAGANGADGATGPMGLPGIPGVNGTDGATGAVGSMGPAGTNGVDGTTGPVGPAGPTGLTGPVGPAGVATVYYGAPTPQDDMNDGYVTGTIWVDMDSGEAYIMIADDPEAAVWMLPTVD